jgi:extracellular elastinolytic metalloproteinase
VLRLPDGHHWYDLFVDASTGAVLDKFDWITEEAIGPPAGSYDVIPFPAESPLDLPQTTVVGPADPTASPFGWHDTNGAAGAEFTVTKGNNVFAQTDLDANNNPAGEIQPDGGAGLVFDWFFDEVLGPYNGENKEASVVNLFHWNNIVHDILYQYGFNEPAGNFQENNYGNGGVGGDPVQADALDGSGTDNANFATPPDGSDPRMQMYRWVSPFAQIVTVNSPGGIAGDYVANPSNNGGTANGLTADLALVVDGTPPTDDACETVTNNLTGKIALIRWSEGLCNSSVFVANAAAAGAVAAIIIDITDVPYTNFGGSAAIPSVAVGQSDGNLFVANLPVNATIDDNPSAYDRDSDFDSGVIAHEYGHGVSNRLTGGPSNVNCLGHPEQAGEGWSDWQALTLFADPADTSTTIRGLGNYVTFRPADGDGIRNFPYTTDLGVNPQTYIDIGTTNIPHGVGEIWAAMLWEVYWNLVDRYGFDSDIYFGTGGNNLAMQLVIDGMKLQPCSPTFVQARNAILAADDNANGSANECEIWHGFAKRGLGFSAIAGGTGVGDEIEAFDLPPGVPAVCNALFTDSFESGDLSAWDQSAQ